MHLRNKSAGGNSRYELAHARVVLYGMDATIARLERYSRSAARLERNCSELIARLRRETANRRNVERPGSPGQSNYSAWTPRFERPETFGRSLKSKANHNRNPGNRPSTADRYKRINARPGRYGQRYTSAVNEIVRQVVESFAPAIAELAFAHLRRTTHGGAKVLRTSGVSFYERADKRADRYAQRFFDESKHPRAPAGRSNGGQFIEKTSGTRPGNNGMRIGPVTGESAPWAGVGGRFRTSNRSEEQIAGVMTSAQVAALLAPGLVGDVRSRIIGHHPLPVAVAKAAYIEGKITLDSFKLALETYFKDPKHGWKEYDDIHHETYSEAVKDQLDDLVKANDKKPIDKNVMEKFLKNLTEGKGADGNVKSTIKRFNDEVLGIAGDALKKTGETLEKAGSRNIDDVIRRCDTRKAFWGNRLMGAALAGATGFLGANAQAAITTVGSEHLRKAVECLNEGDIPGAEKEIFGPNRSGISGLIAEIENNGSPLAAQNAQKFFEELFTRLPKERDSMLRLLEGKHVSTE